MDKRNYILTEGDLTILWKATAMKDFSVFLDRCEYILTNTLNWQDLFYLNEMNRAIKVWENRCEYDNYALDLLKRFENRSKKIESKILHQDTKENNID